MVYYKLILNDKRSKHDSIYPVVIRITANRVASTLTTGIRVNVQHWDKHSSSIKKTHPNWQVLNQSLLDFYTKVQREILKLQDENTFSFEALKLRLTDQDSSNKANGKTSFNDFVEQLISEMRELNKSGNSLIYQTAWNRFSKFSGGKRLEFTDIDYNLLEGFKRQLLRDAVKTNTISNYFRTIRAIYNRGIKAKLVDRSHYPFLDVAIKSERTQKRAIHMNDVARLQRLPLLPNSPAWHSRNYFLLSMSLIGISFTDLAYLKPTNIPMILVIMFIRPSLHLFHNPLSWPSMSTFKYCVLSTSSSSNITHILNG
jgi:integrase/recombinase XerD